jgi:hypothetical protein
MVQIDGPPAPKGFFDALGKFHAIWQALDVVIDFSIGHFRGLDAAATLGETKGMMFGSKMRELKTLVGQSDHPEKAVILECMSKLFRSHRSELTHSYFASASHAVQFVYNGNKHGERARSLLFTGEQFIQHVADFAIAATAFQKSLSLNADEVEAFTAFAIASAPQRT